MKRLAGSQLSEPRFLLHPINLPEFFIALGEVDDSLNESDDTSQPAGHERNSDPDESACGIPEEKSMDPKATNDNSANTRGNLLTDEILLVHRSSSCETTGNSLAHKESSLPQLPEIIEQTSSSTHHQAEIFGTNAGN